MPKTTSNNIIANNTFENPRATDLSLLQDLVQINHLKKNGDLYSPKEIKSIKDILFSLKNSQKLKKINARKLPFSVLVSNENKEEAYVLYNSEKESFQFKKTGYLGTGSFGQVKLSQEIFTKKWFAVKIINTFQRFDTLFLYYYFCCGLRDIQNEINILEHLKLLQNVFTIRNKIYIIQKLSLGKTLANLPYLNTYQNLSIIYQLIQKTLIIHKHNIVNCDIHPDNIMYDITLDALDIIDYGNSQFLKHGVARKLFLIGIPDFIAPELNKSMISYHTKATDWYAVGKVIFLLLYSINLQNELLDQDYIYLKKLAIKLTDITPEIRTKNLERDLNYLANLRKSLDRHSEMFAKPIKAEVPLTSPNIKISGSYSFFNELPEKSSEQLNNIPAVMWCTTLR